MKKIVLAYSGGLDTSVILKWLQNKYKCEVVTFTADIGQGEELEPVERKAKQLGVKEIFIENLQREFVRDYVFPMFRANALYEGSYLLGTAIARPLIAKRQIEIAREVGAEAVAHGATGKGNDQVRFEFGYYANSSTIKVIAPWRNWEFESRSDLIDYAQKNQIEVRTQSALNLPSVAEAYIRRRAIRHLEKGRLVLFAGGTGNPFMSTDTAAALRAVEINADILIMAKNGVDGMYDSDPHKNKSAKKISEITHHEALSKRLEALDSTALTLCMDNTLPIIIFDLFKPDNLLNVISGQKVGTKIYTPKKT